MLHNRSLSDGSVASGGLFNRGTQPSAPVDVNDITGSDPSLPITGTRKARVLYDYDASDTTELSVLADEVIYWLWLTILNETPRLIL